MKRSGAGIVWTLACEVAPAAIFGGAAALSFAALVKAPLLSTTPVAVGAAAFGGVWLLLRRLGSSRRLYIHEFDVSAFEPQEADPAPELDELVLEDVADGPDELVLEDPIPRAEEDSRVIRLFNPADMQTAGELQARIERHLRTSSRHPLPDATQELHDALAALRQSLR